MTMGAQYSLSLSVCVWLASRTRAPADAALARACPHAPAYSYFSVSLGFHPDSPRRDYLIMILSDPTHRLLYETRAPVIVGCTLN